MIRLIVYRLVAGGISLWLVSVVVFAATQALPGNAALAILGQTATPERVAVLTQQLHLNTPVSSQYVQWLSGLLRGNLGTSLETQAPVNKLLAGPAMNSLILVLLTATVAIPLSLSIGILSAVRRDHSFDHVVSVAMLTLAALPEYVIGIGLVLLLGIGLILHVLPAVSVIPPGQPPWRYPVMLVLPVITLVLAVTPYIYRSVRGSMVEVLDSEYVEMARLKGLRWRTVVMRHALPNAIAPALQVTAVQLGWLAGGVVLVEYVFQYPGIGTALVNAVANRDIPVVQTLTVMVGAVYVGVNVVADVVTILITPRLRTGLR